MKNIKKTIFAAFVLFITTSLIVSCSNENESDSSNAVNTEIDQLLKSFYNTSYTFGKSISIKNEPIGSDLSRTFVYNGHQVEITEVIIDGNIRVRGYILTNKETGALMYFVDVNRTDFELTIFDAVKNETVVFAEINTNSRYLLTNEFDFYQMAEDHNSSGTTIESGRFFGPAFEQGPCGETLPNGESAGPGQAYVYKNYYVFGIRVSHVIQESVDGSGTPLKEPCGSRDK